MSDPRDKRIAELEAQLREAPTDSMISILQKLTAVQAELAGWKRVAVEAVIPLEAMRAAGTDRLHGEHLQRGIAHAVAVVRRAAMGEGLPTTPDPA